MPPPIFRDKLMSLVGKRFAPFTTFFNVSESVGKPSHKCICSVEPRGGSSLPSSTLSIFTLKAQLEDAQSVIWPDDGAARLQQVPLGWGTPGFRVETRACDSALISELLVSAHVIIHAHVHIFFLPGFLGFWITVCKFQNDPGSLSGL